VITIAETDGGGLVLPNDAGAALLAEAIRAVLESSDLRRSLVSAQGEQYR
jgi:hypothetical protein